MKKMLLILDKLLFEIQKEINKIILALKNNKHLIQPNL